MRVFRLLRIGMLASVVLMVAEASPASADPWIAYPEPGDVILSSQDFRISLPLPIVWPVEANCVGAKTAEITYMGTDPAMSTVYTRC